MNGIGIALLVLTAVLFVALRFYRYVCMRSEATLRALGVGDGLERFLQGRAECAAVQARFPSDLRVAAETYGLDHVQKALLRSSMRAEYALYSDAKEEIMSAWQAGRFPEEWAVELVRSYRQAHAAAAFGEASRVRQGAARPSRPQSWRAEVVRPKRTSRSEIPN